MYFEGQIWGKIHIVWEYGANIQFEIDLFGLYYVYVTCSYSDKNIVPHFLEKIKNMKKC